MDKKYKILIITHYFPPINAIASHRPYSWAKYWSRMGHNITVLTTKKEPKSNDLNLDCSFFKVIEAENIIRNKLKHYILKHYIIGDKTNISDVENILANSLSTKESDNYIFFKIINFCNKKGILTWDARFPNLFDFWISPAFKEIEKNKYDIIISTFAPYTGPGFKRALN